MNSDTFEGHAPLSAGERQSADPDGHGQTVPDDHQDNGTDDESDYDDYIVIGNDD